MRDKVPILVYLDREIASAFQKKFPRTASEMVRKCVEHSLRHPSFLHDVLYCDFDEDRHCFHDFLEDI